MSNENIALVQFKISCSQILKREIILNRQKINVASLSFYGKKTTPRSLSVFFLFFLKMANPFHYSSNDYEEKKNEGKDS